MNITQTWVGSTSRLPNVVLWIVQVFLAIIFLVAGFAMTFQPLNTLANTINWVSDVPAGMVRCIGISEILAAIGLIVPAIIGIWPQLTAFAASGVAFVMASASIFHFMRGEFFALPMTIVLTGLAAFVEYGRWKLAPLQ